MGIKVHSINLTIEGLQFGIPSLAAVHPHINTSLFTDNQRRMLDDESDRLYFLAGRAIGYWLRLVRWKTGFHLINQLTGFSSKGHVDGGALVNVCTETK